MKTLGDRVRELLEEKGWGFNELDRKIGQGSGYTTRLVANKKKRPDPDIVHRIAVELGVDYEWLVKGIGERTRGASASSEAGPEAPADETETISVATLESHGGLDRIFEQAFLPGHHNVLAANAVLGLIRSHALQIPAKVDPVVCVRAWLDVASALKRRDEPIVPETVSGKRPLPLAREEREARRQRAANAEGHTPKPPSSKVKKKGTA